MNWARFTALGTLTVRFLGEYFDLVHLVCIVLFDLLYEREGDHAQADDHDGLVVCVAGNVEAHGETS